MSRTTIETFSGLRTNHPSRRKETFSCSHRMGEAVVRWRYGRPCRVERPTGIRCTGSITSDFSVYVTTEGEL